ncbi:MAG: hypothetical protein FWF95_05155 [Syntrophorhabdaceae bacterium]|nr:hypothetical protein [Syntrophorhabdaceae bacterium]
MENTLLEILMLGACMATLRKIEPVASAPASEKYLPKQTTSPHMPVRAVEPRQMFVLSWFRGKRTIVKM